MTETAIRAEVHQALDVHRDFLAKVTFDLVGGLENVADLGDLGVRDVVGALGAVDLCFLEDLHRTKTADAEDVGESDVHALVAREVDAGNTSHGDSPNELADQPWRCLCRGFSQMTRMIPLRRTTLHLSQIFLTDA